MIETTKQGKFFVTKSTENKYIENAKGQRFSDAWDIVEVEYFETNIEIETDEPQSDS